jgi:hypothetical protein
VNICERCKRAAFRCVCGALGAAIGLGTILPSQLSDLPPRAATVPVVTPMTNATLNSSVFVFDTITDRQFIIPPLDGLRFTLVERSERDDPLA